MCTAENTVFYKQLNQLVLWCSKAIAHLLLFLLDATFLMTLNLVMQGNAVLLPYAHLAYFLYIQPYG